MNPDVRIEGESYEDYKKRLKQNHKNIKAHFKGTIIRPANAKVKK